MGILVEQIAQQVEKVSMSGRPQAMLSLCSFLARLEMRYNRSQERTTMSLVAIARRLPQELQFPMLEFAEAIEEDLRAQLAVRREDFEALQATVHELADSQRRSEQRLDRLETVVLELTEAQKRTEQRVEELAEAQKRTEQRVEELAEAQKRTEQRLDDLIAAIQRLTMRVDGMQVRMDGLIGDNLERRYRERAYAYFGRVLRQVQVVSWNEIEERLEERLAEKEVDDLRPLDLLVRGRPKDAAIGDQLWLAVEVSKVVDRVAVERALRRAAMLRKAGFLAVPGAAGEEHTIGCDDAARDTGVVLVLDGVIRFWDEAIQRVCPA
jgi:chromosome segregation ATPase